MTRSDPAELLVSEIFGPTIQGEGPSTGRSAVFLRLGMCNLTCRWCDTSYTWDPAAHDLRQELKYMTHQAIVADLLSRGAGLIVITGGEPLLQAEQLIPVVKELSHAGRRVEFETAGTVMPAGLITLADRFIVSPKLANSGQSEARRLRWPVLAVFAALPHVTFKFVVTSQADLEEVDGIAGKLGLAPERVWVMPEGTTTEKVILGMRDLVDPVTRRGWALSGRLHILLWGDQRGK